MGRKGKKPSMGERRQSIWKPPLLAAAYAFTLFDKKQASPCSS